MWLNIAKWIVTAILIPLAEKWWATYSKAKKQAARFKKKKVVAEAKGGAYENDPSDSSRNDLP